MKLSETAEKMGREAFKAGKKCIPALDKEIMAFAFANGNRYRLILESWTNGWTEENLDAPVPGWTEEENRKLREYRENFKKGII
jgi:hypothetical protein